MSGLVEKLEAAEVGSRELDGAVWYAVHEPDVEHGCLHVEQTEQGPMEVLTCELGSKYADHVGNYTTSLDAALALAERVLPGDPDFQPTGPSVGWKINLYRGMVPEPLGGWIATVRRHASDGFDGSAQTPALALCIAILRALNLNETRHAE